MVGNDEKSMMIKQPINMLHDLHFDAVILGNGDFPTAPLPLQILKETPYIVCCDGAADEYIRRGYVPNAIVGDGDSLSDNIIKTYNEIIHRNSNQETNDQTKAVEFLLNKGFNKIAIVGATGKREDHTLGNISLLAEYIKMGVDITIYTDYGVFIPCRGKKFLPSFCRQQVSIFNINAHHMKSEGLRYPIYDFTNWWQGTLNEALSESITIHADGTYIVFMTYTAK